jgi:hypothetical protein
MTMSRMPTYLTLPMLLVLGGAILSAAGACIATIRQNQEKLQSATQRAQFESELRAKSDEIASLNREIAASITGGDSFPIAMYMPAIDLAVNDPNVLSVAIRVEGKYPLFDAEFEHQDITLPLPEDGIAALEAWKEGHLPRLQGGTLHVGIMVPRGLITLRPEETYKKLKLTTFARNGHFVQNTELKRGPTGRWEMHYKVVKAIPGEESKVLKDD